jgi:tRNA-uridine 2-sulfurtransferase
MGNKGKSVVVAISGGVDSSTAAAVLIREGFNCAGVYMIAHDSAQKSQQMAEQTARQLGIELFVLDLRNDFKGIIEYFCNEYEAGRTPNPCVVCNKTIKFGKLWEFAKSKGADFLATGHYARILPTAAGAGLFRGVDEPKDQSYALAMINSGILGHILLPMGNFSKKQTREMARQFGLVTADSEESQEICFIPDNDYVGFLERHSPDIVKTGKIIDESGRVLGEHSGIHRFTIGQRRGVRVAMGQPWYVTKVNAQTNTVTLGPKSEVMCTKLTADKVNWLIEKPASSFKAKVKIRYNAKPVNATVLPQGDSVVIEFDEPVSAITPGQLSVFYINGNAGLQVAGAGWIDGFEF